MSTAADAAADAAALTVIHFVFYVLAGIGIGISVGVNLYVVIALEDLQSDLVNPHDATRRINRLVVWDIGSHAIGTAFMLLSGHWIVAAMNVPLIYYHAEGYVFVGPNLHSVVTLQSARARPSVRLCSLARSRPAHPRRSTDVTRDTLRLSRTQPTGGRISVCSWM